MNDIYATHCVAAEAIEFGAILKLWSDSDPDKVTFLTGNEAVRRR